MAQSNVTRADRRESQDRPGVSSRPTQARPNVEREENQQGGESPAASAV